jgi:hypothetical protein
MIQVRHELSRPRSSTASITEKRVLKSSLLSIALTAVLASPAVAQSCSKLAVEGTGKPGTDLTFKLSGGAAKAPAVLFVATETGKTTIKLGTLGTLELGLAMPVIPVPMPVTDASGASTLVIPIPKAKIPEIALHGQGTTVKFTLPPPKLTFCTSNVVDFKIGGE